MKINDLPPIGSSFEGGFRGSVIGMRAAVFAIIWAPSAEGQIILPWFKKGKVKDVPGARSCFDSDANTRALAEAGSPLGEWAMGLKINGFDDWRVPARDVLETAYRDFKPTTDATGGYFRDGDNPSSVPPGYPYAIDPILQTTVTAFQQGNPEAFDATWNWSSTQYSEGSAWGQGFSSGGQYSNLKTYEAPARAVRLIQLDA